MPESSEHEPRPEDRPAAREPMGTWWIWAVYVALFSLSIPWYAPDSNVLWLGFPYWVVLSLGATFGAAIFTLFVIRNFWESDS